MLTELNYIIESHKLILYNILYNNQQTKPYSFIFKNKLNELQTFNKINQNACYLKICLLYRKLYRKLHTSTKKSINVELNSLLH